MLDMESWFEYYGYNQSVSPLDSQNQCSSKQLDIKNRINDHLNKVEKIIWDQVDDAWDAHKRTWMYSAESDDITDMAKVVDENGDTVFSYLGLLFDGCEIKQDEHEPCIFYVSKA